MHSVMNSLYAKKALVNTKIDFNEYEGYETLSKVENQNLRNKVEKYALQNGMTYIKDSSGTNIDVQLFDISS